MPVYHLPLSELQRSLYERLTAILECGVLDHQVGKHTLPYASIGEFTVTPGSGRNVALITVQGTIHLWSESEGQKECQEIANTIIASLTTEKLPMSGYTVLLTSLSSFATVAEWTGDKLLRHGTLVMSWIIQ